MAEGRSMFRMLRGAASAAVFFISWLVVLSLLTVLLHPAIMDTFSGNAACMRLALEVLSLASVAVPTALFAWMHPAARAAASRAGVIKAVSLGVAAGLAWLGAALGANWLVGSLSLGPAAPVSRLVLWLAACLANAAFQELLVRGYSFDSLSGSLGAVPATLLTTVLFVAFHPGAFASGSVAVFQMAAASLLLTELRVLTGGLVAPTAAHFVWNAAGGIGLGVVALADDYPHVLSLSVGAGTSLSAGAMGIEGSLRTLLVTVALCAALSPLVKRLRRSVRPSVLADECGMGSCEDQP